ncbi:MAG: flippase-like domain-containing protein, partial [Muribaculaceae bacterium]|nr:flippase-like domain-containing protein [Muribaculaceae bacterium]
GEFNPEVFSGFEFSWRMGVALFAAAIFVIGRDFGLSWRFHIIAGGDLSWARAVKVDLMCAFTSAITPSVVGGSALAVFYLNREGINVGRATTLTLTTLFLDELFFVIFCPVLVLLIPDDELFGAAQAQTFITGVRIVFWIVYAGIVIWTAILFAGIIAKPRAVADIMHKIFSLRPLRRWQGAIDRTTGNMIETSSFVKTASRKWWLKVFGATVVSWFSRYLVVNALFWGFVPAASGLLVFGRQFVVWVVLMVSPTPGGSGVSEWLFTNYYGDLIGNVSIALILALLWRVLSYYVYLIAGCCLLPSYFSKRKTSDK